MPEIRVKINWDKPEKQYWLNKYNIDLALSAYCPNTKFEVEEIEDESKEDPISKLARTYKQIKEAKKKFRMLRAKGRPKRLKEEK